VTKATASDPLLVHIPCSPWSLRARLALDLGRVIYRRRVHGPILGELWLRFRLGRSRQLRPGQRVTAPVLLTEQGAVLDSLDIARLALSGTPLWPDDPALKAWNRWSEQLLSLGRCATTRRVRADHDALIASLPPALAGLGPLSTLIGRLGAARILSKYGHAGTDAELEQQQDALLDQLDGALGGDSTLLGTLSYADLTVAAGLSFIRPPAQLSVPEAARGAWTSPVLAKRYAHLLDWRDRVLADCAHPVGEDEP